MAKLIYISQPMRGLKQETIGARRAHAVEILRRRGFEVANPAVVPLHSSATNHPLYCLGRSIEDMARCDGIYLLKGWEKARGCRIEHDAAREYSLSILYEDVLESQTRAPGEAARAKAWADTHRFLQGINKANKPSSCPLTVWFDAGDHFKIFAPGKHFCFYPSWWRTGSDGKKELDELRDRIYAANINYILRELD